MSIFVISITHTLVVSVTVKTYTSKLYDRYVAATALSLVTMCGDSTEKYLEYSANVEAKMLGYVWYQTVLSDILLPNKKPFSYSRFISLLYTAVFTSLLRPNFGNV